MTNETLGDIALAGPDPIAALLEKSSAGDHAALTALKQELPQCEDLLLGIYGDLATRVQEALICAQAGVDLLDTEGLRLRIADLRAELTGPAASPLECVLIERIFCTWLHAYLCDLSLAKHNDEYHHRARLQKLQAEADRRLFRACRALAQVQKSLTRSPRINTDSTRSRPSDQFTRPQLVSKTGSGE